MTFSLDQPVTTLDPFATDVVAEGHRLRQLGTIVPIRLDDAVSAWCVADYEAAEKVFTSPDFSKDPSDWAAYQDGLIPKGWPLLKLITMESMLNRKGVDHARLRSLLSKDFTPRRIERLRPTIEAMAAELVDELAAANGVIDLRRDYAFALPMRVISHLFGVDDLAVRTLLAEYYGVVISSQSEEEEVLAAGIGLGQILGKLIETKRAAPGDDLTSALITAHDGQDRLTGKELIETLLLMLFAGHETSKNLITNTVWSLLKNPGQLAAARSGADPDWTRTAVEETLRWRSPIRVVMFYYAVNDVHIDGVWVRAGEPVLLYIAATGRDQSHFGPTADDFDLSRTTAAQHLSFARGAHYCIGAPLGRMTATIALDALFTRFDVASSDLDGLTPEQTYASNSFQSLPVTLTALAPV
ncbi:cytochrome P450 family protein [Streptomyces sp. 4N124]|uniref:cytochrome P450 family protein n=1 Tax=Streptomyces sp. 4N124 TaxID=3457420 RepID=UPI003FCF4BB8